MTGEFVALGFDPGLATTGYGIVRATDGEWEAVAGGVIETEKGVPRADRLQTIYREARALIETYRPNGVAIEERTRTIHLIPIGQAIQRQLELVPADVDLTTVEPANRIVRKVFDVFGKTGLILSQCVSAHSIMPWESTLAMIDEWKNLR